MVQFKISIIAAIGKNRELGKGNRLLWNIPEDMLHFKTLTTGHPVIMGRKTFESIGKPLPNRTNIVVTKNKNFKPEGVIVTHSLEQAISIGESRDSHEIFIIGGGEIYNQALRLADKLYLTVVDGKFDADTFFPDYSDFKNIIYQREGSDNNFKFTFLELSRH